MTDSPTVSSVRITGPDGVDHTATYESLYRVTAGPLRALTAGPADSLVLTLLCIANNGSGSTNKSLPWDPYDRVIDIGNDGEGEFVTGAGWTVTVTKDDVEADTFTAATKAFHEASRAVADSALKLVCRDALRQWPTATGLVLEGHWNEDGEARVRVTEVHVPDAGRLSVEDGNDDVDEFDDAQNGPLMYLADTTGDDYIGRTWVPLVEDALDPADEDLLDTAGSASRQHHVDTGRYLTHAEVAEYATLGR